MKRLAPIILLLLLLVTPTYLSATGETYAYMYQSQQPDLTLSNTTIQPGDAIAPHLYDIYLDGVDDWVGGLTAFTVGGVGFKETIMVSMYVEDVTVYDGAWDGPMFGGNQHTGAIWIQGDIDSYGRHALAIGIGGIAWTGSLWASFPQDMNFAGTINIIDANNTEFTVYLNGNTNSRTITVTDNRFSNTYTCAPHVARSYFGGLWMKGYVRFMLAYLDVLSTADIENIFTSKELRSTSLQYIFDPTWFNGTHYIDPVNGFIWVPQGGATRVLAEEKWLWVVKQLYSDGYVHLRFFPAGSRVDFVDVATGVTVVSVTVDGSVNQVGLVEDFLVSIPPGNYTVKVWLGGGRWVALDLSKLVEENIVFSDLRDVAVVSDEAYIDYYNPHILYVEKPFTVYLGGNPDYNNSLSKTLFTAKPSSMNYTVTSATVTGTLADIQEDDGAYISVTYSDNPGTADIYVNFTLNPLFTVIDIVSVELKIMYDSDFMVVVYIYNYTSGTWVTVVADYFTRGAWIIITKNINADVNDILRNNTVRLRLYLRGYSAYSEYHYIDYVWLYYTAKPPIAENITLTPDMLEPVNYLVRFRLLKEEDGSGYQTGVTIQAVDLDNGRQYQIEIPNTTRSHFVTVFKPELVIVKDNATGIKRELRYSSGELCFYFPTAGTVYDYTFTVQDLVGFLSGKDYFIVKKWVNGALVTVFEDRILESKKVLVPLKYGDMYQISVYNGYMLKTVGWITMDSATSKPVYITGVEEEHGKGLYINARYVDGVLKIYYTDYDNLTLTGSRVYVLNSSGYKVFEAELANDTVASFIGVHENETYTVIWDIVRTSGNLTFTRVIMPGNPYYQPFPLNLTGVFGDFLNVPVETWLLIIIVIIVAGAAGQLHSGIGLMLSMGIAGFFAYMGWLNVPWSILSILMSLSALYALSVSKKYWNR